jgi:hypothetical protein
MHVQDESQAAVATKPRKCMLGDVHLIGSMPFESAELVFRAAAGAVGDVVSAIPDGEVGDRRNWVRYLPMRVYADHPQLEETSREDAPSFIRSDDDSRSVRARPAPWTFRIRDGERLCFDDLHYGRHAIESYAVFSRLRDEGVIQAEVRLQVAFPASGSAINPFFEDLDDWEEAHRAYELGIRREIAKMLEIIPPGDLLIQWDLAWEVVDIASGDSEFYDFWPHQTTAEKLDRHSRQLSELWKGIPDDVLLGYHWCYGTRGGWPMTAMDDLSLCVALSNEAISRAGRRIDFVHMPVVKDPSDAFLAPLSDLEIGDARLYLGLIHHDDSDEAFRRRLAKTRKRVHDIGIAAVCGYGRDSQRELKAALAAHRRCAQILHET